MAAHVDGRPTGPTAEDITQRRKLIQTQATRQRGHRPNRLDAKLEMELANRYRRAHMTQFDRDIEDSVNSRPHGKRREGHCEAPGCFRGIHARRLCMRHYQRQRRSLRSRT